MVFHDTSVLFGTSAAHPDLQGALLLFSQPHKPYAVREVLKRSEPFNVLLRTDTGAHFNVLPWDAYCEINPCGHLAVES